MLAELFKKMGLSKRTSEALTYWVLDGFSPDFYLTFVSFNGKDKVDIAVCEIGSYPLDADRQMTVVSGANLQGVQRFLFALGVSRFSEPIRRGLYETVGSPLRGLETSEE